MFIAIKKIIIFKLHKDNLRQKLKVKIHQIIFNNNIIINLHITQIINRKH